MNGLCRVAGLIVLIALMVGDVRWSNVLAQQAGDRKSEEAEKNEAARVEPNEEKPKGEVVTIPLDQIWAYDMPGTRDISHLIVDDPLAGQRPSSLEYILRKLRSEPPDADAMDAFAFTGPPQTALGKARIALYGRSPAEGDSLPASSDIYIAFFAKACAYDVRLEKVTRRGGVIDIHYQFVPRYTPVPAVTIALIPVGKLPVGEYRVDVNQMPMTQEHVDAGFAPVSEQQARRIVCGPFSFSIITPQPPDPGPSPDAVEIPLDQIWGWRMPGTRPMNASMRDGQYIAEEGRLLYEIRRSLAVRLPAGKKASPGFAVVGSGLDALKAAHAVLVEGNQARQTFKKTDEITLVFFSYKFGPYVHIHRVERHGNVIELHYRFVPHFSETLTEHFALIPLGKVPVGKYRVEVVMSSGKPNDADTADRIVCRSFSFSVLAD